MANEHSICDNHEIELKIMETIRKNDIKEQFQSLFTQVLIEDGWSKEEVPIGAKYLTEYLSLIPTVQSGVISLKK